MSNISDSWLSHGGKAFPSISTGIYGYPIIEATRIALDEVRRFLDSEVEETVCVTLNLVVDFRSHSSVKLDRVIFVVWSDKDKKVYQ
jgi:O-acetyl-ADP-ribose deacetylase (regulator of RNase III)